MSSDKPKFTLNLNETNTLGFALTIEGSSSDVDATNPVFRFVLAERNGEKAWLYPMVRDEEGDVVVSIPSENFFLEEKEYQGQVEVVLGNHYFVPTTVDIEFIKPLRVTARTKNKVKKETVVESTNKPMVLKPKKTKTTWEDLTVEEQKKVVEYLRQKKLNELRKAKEIEEKKKKLQERKQQESRVSTIKDQLKSLLSDSLSDDE